MRVIAGIASQPRVLSQSEAGNSDELALSIKLNLKGATDPIMGEKGIQNFNRKLNTPTIARITSHHVGLTPINFQIFIGTDSKIHDNG
ncbi:MAG: hypothetical protein ACI9W6_000146 [Motiliproteus sp.]|jgi:hypothetical protein